MHDVTLLQERLLVGKLSTTFYINIERQKWNLNLLTHSNPEVHKKTVVF